MQLDKKDSRYIILTAFRNILVHEYLEVDWQEVYRNLQQIDDLAKFAEMVREWLRQQTT